MPQPSPSVKDACTVSEFPDQVLLTARSLSFDDINQNPHFIRYNFEEIAKNQFVILS